MRIGLRHWLIAGLLAVALNAAVILLISMQENAAGAATIRPGPQVEMADSLAGIMGEPLEVSEIQPEKIDEIEPEPEVVEMSKPVELAATAPVVVPENIQLLEALPVAPTMELKTTEPAPVLTPATPEKKVETREVPKKVEPKQKKTKKTKTKKATKTKKRTTKTRGSSKNGQAGKSKTGRASASAIAGFGSQVRGRIASAARRAARGKGSVRVTVSISSSGSASVRVSGPGALASAVRSAVSGTSFPRPPQGAPRSYSVSITFR